MSEPEKTRLVKPKTKRGVRALKEREPQLVEEAKKVLLLYGNKPSQVGKDLLTDLHKLQPGLTVKYTRRNEDVLPFDSGGEIKIEYFASKVDCGQFALTNHTKKRPNNLVLGRFYDGRILDLLEVGVDNFKSIKSFGGAGTRVQAENKPCIVFCGDQFENEPAFKLAKSILLDFFRGRVVEGIDLMGVDHVIYVTARDRTILFRQYAIKLKKSGTKIPRVELTEMGPSMDLQLRRSRTADLEVEKQALQQPRLTKKKEKNVNPSATQGKVGRIYMPKQQIDSIPQHKMKALKRNRELDAGTPEAGSLKGKKSKNSLETT